MNKIENIVLIDMDGTLCDYETAIRRDYNKIKAPTDPPYKYFKERYLKNRINLIRNQPGWWENLKELKLGFDILEVARELEFKINILTKGPQNSSNAWTEKANWCRKHVPDALITMTEDKGLVYGKVLVDDYPEYIKKWLEWRPRGLVIMPNNQKLNKNFQHPNVILYDGSNLQEVKKALKEARDRN